MKKVEINKLGYISQNDVFHTFDTLEELVEEVRACRVQPLDNIEYGDAVEFFWQRRDFRGYGERIAGRVADILADNGWDERDEEWYARAEPYIESLDYEIAKTILQWVENHDLKTNIFGIENIRTYYVEHKKL